MFKEIYLFVTKGQAMDVICCRKSEVGKPETGDGRQETGDGRPFVMNIV